MRTIFSAMKASPGEAGLPLERSEVFCAEIGRDLSHDERGELLLLAWREGTAETVEKSIEVMKVSCETLQVDDAPAGEQQPKSPENPSLTLYDMVYDDCLIECFRLAVERDDMDILKLVYCPQVNYMVENSYDIQYDGGYFGKVLAKMVKLGRFDILKFLCQAVENWKVNEELEYSWEYALKVPLLKAAKLGHLDIVKFLVEIGATCKEAECEINEKNILWYASSAGHIHVLDYLLNEEKVTEYINIDADDGLCLKGAIQNEQLEIIDYLLARGAEVSKRIIKKALIDNENFFLKSYVFSLARGDSQPVEKRLIPPEKLKELICTKFLLLPDESLTRFEKLYPEDFSEDGLHAKKKAWLRRARTEIFFTFTILSRSLYYRPAGPAFEELFGARAM